MTTPFHGNLTLQQADPEVYLLIRSELQRQCEGLELIASENFTYRAVLEANGSCLTNKYSEGYPGARYYGGNEHVDSLEVVAKERALSLFNLSSDEWGVNVQPYSGSPANLEALHALLKPGERLMGLSLPDGGHLTHGHRNEQRAVSATAAFYDSHPYYVDKTTGHVDYAALEKEAIAVQPRIIICGGSAYPREWDYARLRSIADKAGALLMADMAHVAGLVAGGEAVSPFQFVDIVTSTSHKTLRGPRSGLIFYRKKWEKAINRSVFPGLQGGPHNHTIAALAVTLRIAATDEFRVYARQIVANARRLADCMIRNGYVLVTGGTDNHLILWDLRPLHITGSKMEKLLELICISVNKNSIPGDRTAEAPGAVRIGSPALTARGFVEKDFEVVADLLHRACQLALSIQARTGRLLKDFAAAAMVDPAVLSLREEVKTLALRFPMPGVEESM